jgi:peptidylprolyl isomerase
MKRASIALAAALLVACGKAPAEAQDGGDPAKPAAPQDPGQPELKIEVVAPGDGREVKQGDIVLAHLIMSLPDGKALMEDTRKKGEPLPFAVGIGMQLPAIDLMLAKMRQGARFKSTAPFVLAFGEQGIPGRIPPRTDVLIDIEVVGFLEMPKEVLATGSGTIPRRGEKVFMHYTGWTTDGKQFDSSRERGEPLVVSAGEGGVIQGWQIVIAQMRPGDRWKVTIPWQLAYGERGRPPQIPAKADLVFDMERIPVPEAKFEIVKEGEGAAAARGDAIVLHFTASLPDGKELASSRSKDEPVLVYVGAGGLFPNWDWTPMLSALKVGGRAKATVPSALVGGPQGRPSSIPPKTDVLVDVERLPMPDVTMEFEKQGDGPLLKPGQAVKVHYVGTLTDGKEFDNSRKRNEPIPVTLGTHGVIPGWEMALAKMRVGDHAKVTIPWLLAYGAAGSPPNIPPKADLVFDMEVVEAQ